MNNKPFTLIITFLLAVVSLTFGQGAGIEQLKGNPPSGSVQSDQREFQLPNLGITNLHKKHAAKSYDPNKGNRSTWEVQFNYDITTPGKSQFGVETDGTYFYTAKWAGDTIFKYDLNGNFIEYFRIVGVPNFWDLAFDGTYFYTGANSNIIYQMDFTSKTLVGTITCPAATKVVNIAFDPDNNGFWVGGWTSNISLVNYSGAVMNTILYSSLCLKNISGSAYDNYSIGGPYLWISAQGTGSNECKIAQIKIATKTCTGLEKDLATEVAIDVSPYPEAGGLFIHSDIISGTVTLGGMIQNFPNRLFGYNLASTFKQNNIGISKILSPHTGANNTNSESVDVEITNFGLNEQTGFNVSYIIDGNTTVTETINSTIDPFSKINYTFTTPADMSSLGSYSFKIYSSLNNDEDNSDDTLSAIIYSTEYHDPPIIEGTYLPVNGTSVVLVVDTMFNQIPVPTTGQNQMWDYSDKFLNVNDTALFETDYPSKYPHSSNFPLATNASFQISHVKPLHSMDGWGFYKIDTTGLKCIGMWFTDLIIYGVDVDTCLTYTKPMLVTPTQMCLSTDIFDTAVCYGFSTNGGFNIKVIETSYYHHKSVGYGNLITPAGIYNDVLQVKVTGSYIDSVFVDIYNNNSYSLFYQKNSGIRSPILKFFRNNTFASNYLMQLMCGDDSCTNIVYGYYLLPVDIGAITGTVRDSLGAPVTNGKMLLYREHSNFRKNDILSTVPIHNDGTYRFDSIPYGVYRIAARPDTVIYPTALTTFYGDVDNWMTCDTVVTDGDTSGIDITLRYHPGQAGLTTLSGNVMYNLIYLSTLGNKAVGSGRPVKDVDVTVKKKTNKTEEVVAQIQTDTSGNYQISGLENGMYEILVGMPGLHMFSTHELEINNTQILTDFNYYVSLDSIYAVGANSSFIIENETSDSPFAIYPNPCSDGFFLVCKQNESTEVQIRISDVQGRLMASKTVQASFGSPGFISTEGYPSGLYFVECICAGKHFADKLFIEN
ncbi:MAG: carboxypeptidase regulatory-like domain-containing protein [Bacteroidetes bacterium]|nr:carboxypeptidase regulatory-like domain-containing protein [Bacteroidota bacterium]MBU1718455.1 carboxypeptidase regulatory-like domain-containing protein [Bacteroidota bacterium]